MGGGAPLTCVLLPLLPLPACTRDVTPVCRLLLLLSGGGGGDGGLDAVCWGRLGQLISWEGRTGVGEDSQVDIILRSRASTSDDDFRVVMASDARTSTDGVSEQAVRT